MRQIHAYIVKVEKSFPPCFYLKLKLKESLAVYEADENVCSPPDCDLWCNMYELNKVAAFFEETP